MIIHVPHADPTIPSDLRHQFILSGAELDAEVLCSTDWFTDELFSGRKRHMVRFPVSRLVVDPERFEDDGSERMSAVGRGVIYQRTQDGRPLRRQLNPAERKALLDRYYHPHHSNLAAAVQSELTRSGRALIVDAHSFPQEPWAVEPNRDTRRPDFCIGTDPFHTPVPLTRLAMGYLAGNGLSVSRTCLMAARSCQSNGTRKIRGLPLS